MQRDLLKGIDECRKKLLPTADTHRDHNLDLLRKHVGHAVVLLSDPCLPFEVTDDLRTNVGLVHKAFQVVTGESRSCATRKEKRPKLNTDDDENDLSYWDSDDAELDKVVLCASVK